MWGISEEPEAEGSDRDDLCVCVKYTRDLLVMPGDWRGELDPGWIDYCVTW